MMENYLNELRGLLQQAFKNYKVEIFLIGSQAKKTAREKSDIDVAIIAHEDLPIGLLSNIREQIAESTIPYSVDLVDLTQADPKLKDEFLQGAILWSGSNSD